MTRDRPIGIDGDRKVNKPKLRLPVACPNMTARGPEMPTQELDSHFALVRSPRETFP